MWINGWITCRLIAEFSPGKKGGILSLPIAGGSITVQPATLAKKDVITCCVISPNDRYKHQPPLA